jgi:predicted Zn-dependent protease
MFGSRMMRTPARHCARLLPLAALAACSGSIGLEEEARIGDSYAAEIATQTPLIRDPAAVEALNRIGGALAQRADSTGRRYTFYLVDSPEVNAFAIPGGHIYVNRGLVEAADEQAELAGVLGHEIAHVTERHGLEQMEKQQGAGLLITLVYTVLGREPGLVEQVAIQGGGAAIFAKYGRDAEREADQEAIETVVAAGFHPEGVATFFEELLREQQSQPGQVEKWFSTHPTSAERVREARAMIGTLGALDRELLRDTPEYQAFREHVRGLRAAR